MRLIISFVLFVIILQSCSEPTSSSNNKSVQQIVFSSYSGSYFNYLRDSTNIFLMNIDGTGFTNITNKLARYDDISSSPTEKKIAFVSNLANTTGFDARNELYVLDLNTNELINLSNTTSAYEFKPTFMPDGNSIVFISTKSTGNYQLYRVNIDGSNLHPLNDPDEMIWDNFSLSNDSRYILYHKRSYDFGNKFTTHIIRRNIDGTNPINLTPDFEYICSGATFNFDNSKIYFSHAPTGIQAALFCMNIDGSEKETIKDYSDWAIYKDMVFTPKGDKLIFIGGEFFDLFVMDINGQNTVNITDNPWRVQFYDLSHNGKNIVYAIDEGNMLNLYITDIELSEVNLIQGTLQNNRHPRFLIYN
ncbi:MAG: hypothetical protein D8M58_22190 [Calditrichaeota bacterium]|nr:MAG: hypothetical protein DWQ03_08580 [Calditrichota bacterium]MBL1208124.1 hypothetical protein [Calditrichota bacterium]NOG47963.1 hypothetical protein [Calditrichota bacterium]